MNSFGGKILALIIGLAFSAAVMGQSVTIQFSPNGTGSTGAISVNTFDWIPGNAININGAPAGGLTAGSKIDSRSHSKLGTVITSTGLVAPPNGTEFTFVYGLPVVVTHVFPSGTNSPSFVLDNTSTHDNFVELWTSAPDSNMLAGTGFNSGTRILYGRVLDASGTIQVSSPCSPIFGGGATTQFDQFPSAADNNYPGVSTVCATGSSNLSIDVLFANADYFPGFTPEIINTVKSFFNNSHITPFTQIDPSALFVANGSGFDGTTTELTYAPNLGSVNGAVTATDRDFQNQSDSNESFQQGTVVAGGACRVTYGGNDKNGNIDPNKFGSACSSVKGNTQNCYTFGGQVGASTADPAQGGPFGEHTHHQVSGPAGDFVFHAGTHSAPKTTRITATACKDPDACQPAAANARFKQIDFEGTGSFRTLDATAQAYLAANGGGTVLPDNQDTRIDYFRVDMDDLGEPGDKWGANSLTSSAQQFFNDDQNNPLSQSDPTFFNYFKDKQSACSASPHVYQFLICKDANPCGPGYPNAAPPIYAVRAFLTGGNIQIHTTIK